MDNFISRFLRNTLNRLWRLYTNPFTARKKSPIFFSYWHDRPAWIHQESGGVEPPTLIGGPPGGITPIFTLKLQNLKRLVWGWLSWDFQSFNSFQLEMTWIFTYIRSRRVLFNIVEKRADKVRAFFRISFFQFLLYSWYGCALFGFHMPYHNYKAYFGTGSGQNWTGNGHKRDRNIVKQVTIGSSRGPYSPQMTPQNFWSSPGLPMGPSDSSFYTKSCPFDQ